MLGRARWEEGVLIAYGWVMRRGLHGGIVESALSEGKGILPAGFLPSTDHYTF